MEKKTLVIFSQIYLETFLKNELDYLVLKFNEILFFPQNKLIERPTIVYENVKIQELDFNESVYLRKILKNHGFIILKWFFNEFIKSRHRFKYIIEFNWNFHRLVGLLNSAIKLNNMILTMNLKNTIFYSYWFDDWGSILALVKVLNKDFNYITRVHLFDFEEEFYHRKYIPFRYQEINKPQKIIAISEFAVKYIKENYNVKANICRLGVSDKGTNQIIQSKTYTIVSCSSLSWYKRPIILVELIRHLNNNINWIHFGNGIMEQEFIEKTKLLPSNITFRFMGNVDNISVINFYNKNPVNLLINVSEFEGIPVSMMEAISFGIPILGCNICGVPEIVNEQTGILLEKDFDLKDAALKIESFLVTKSVDKEFRKGVKEFWNKNYNADKNYPQFINQYLLN